MGDGSAFFIGCPSVIFNIQRWFVLVIIIQCGDVIEFVVVVEDTNTSMESSQGVCIFLTLVWVRCFYTII